MLTVLRTMTGVMCGAGWLFSYRNLQSVGQGKTDFWAYSQSNIIWNSVFGAVSVLKDIEYADLSLSKKMWIARAAAYPLPFALQILNHRIDEKAHPILKKLVMTTRQHLEHVAFAIDLCTSVVFTIYVAPYFGVGLLVGLTIEVLNDKKKLPAKVRDVWEKVWIGLSVSHLLQLIIYEREEDISNWDVGRFFSEISLFTWETYLEKGPPESPEKPPIHLNTTEELFKKPINQFKVNWPHINQIPRLEVEGSKQIDIVKTMKELIESIEWTPENLHTLKQSLITNTIFLDRYPSKTSLGDISDELAITWCKNCAALLANQIANSAIEKGDAFIRYEILQGIFKSVLKTLKNQSGQNNIADLLQLALEGGDFCASGKVEALEDVYKRRVLGDHSIPLKGKFLHLFQSMRRRWFDSGYIKYTRYISDFLERIKLGKGVFDARDLHFYNISLFYFDRTLRLNSEVLRNDMNIMESGFCSRLYRRLFSLGADYIFWPLAMRSSKWYSAEALVQEIAESSSLSGLSGSEIAAWWQEWIDSLPGISEEKKEKFMDELSDSGKILGHDLTVQAGKTMIFNPVLVKFMLIQMNILQ